MSGQSNLKTFNRGKLLRLAKAGKLVAVDGYNFDYMTGGMRLDQPLPVRVASMGDVVWAEGFVNLFESDFKGACGMAYQYIDTGIIHLKIHSNCNYDFRTVEEK